MKVPIIVLLALLGVATKAENSLEQYSMSNQQFTKDLYRELAKSSGNIIYSPLSAQLILTLIRLGAKGKTAEELDKSLNLPTDLENLKEAVKQIQSEFQKEKQYTLNSVNKVYIKDGYSIKPSYIEIVKNVFSADIENIDFAKTQEASEIINKYVEGKTENLIKNLITPDLLSDLTRLVLINTLYFKSNWSRPFEKELTAPQKFSKSLTESVQIPLMKQTDYFKYADMPQLDAKYLEVPYNGDEVSLSIVLPNKIDGLDYVQRNVGKVFEPRNATYARVALSFPKFKIESNLKLVPVLKNLGVKDLFNDQTSDLSEIAKPDPRLYVSDAIQKAYIKFTESGTTAAAATAFLVGIPYSSLPPPEPVQFTVDHPFIFYLSMKNFVLFAGRVVAPELAE